MDSGSKSRLADIYDIINDPSSDSIISWSKNGKSFIIWEPEQFARDYLPKLLLSQDFSAFTRMLDRFGFTKVGSESEGWEFEDEDFVRGKPKFIHKMIYRKRAQGRIFMETYKSERRKNMEEALELQVDQLFADRLESLKEDTMAIENQLESLENASRLIEDLLQSF